MEWQPPCTCSVRVLVPPFFSDESRGTVGKGVQVQARPAQGICAEEGQEADGQGAGGDQHRGPGGEGAREPRHHRSHQGHPRDIRRLEKEENAAKS